ncbi:Uncharacterised protein [Pseudomonas fluorescens]|uniref:Uncharacterized protein n=1 Tax=Pseudomonas fluorescens TaxID=294 RepID=A0A379IBM9_PSEFL|nr:Uncharacterised protein [Pseudomonas fluorescens]
MQFSLIECGFLMTSRIISWLFFFYCLSTVLLPVFVLNKLFFIPIFLMAFYVLLTRPLSTVAPVIVFLIFCMVSFLG